MIFYLVEKWFFTPLCILLGLFWLRLAYLKPNEAEPIRIRDLFGSRRLYAKTRQQLVVEGVLLFLSGIGAAILFYRDRH